LKVKFWQMILFVSLHRPYGHQFFTKKDSSRLIIFWYLPMFSSCHINVGWCLETCVSNQHTVVGFWNQFCTHPEWLHACNPFSFNEGMGSISICQDYHTTPKFKFTHTLMSGTMNTNQVPFSLKWVGKFLDMIIIGKNPRYSYSLWRVILIPL
jgi:hypothetical protein